MRPEFPCSSPARPPDCGCARNRPREKRAASETLSLCGAKCETAKSKSHRSGAFPADHGDRAMRLNLSAPCQIEAPNPGCADSDRNVCDDATLSGLICNNRQKFLRRKTKGALDLSREELSPLEIRQDKAFVVRRTFELQSEKMSRGAVRAVAAKQPWRFDCFFTTARIARRHAPQCRSG